MVKLSPLPILLSALALPASARLLEPKSEELPKEWPQCLGKTGLECLDIIRATRRGMNFIKPVLVLPRPIDDLKRNYYKVGIYTNFLEEVTGSKKDGQVCYKYPWTSEETGEKRDLGCWDCAGMHALECCNMIKQSVPDKDKNGNHLSCFFQEDHLVPDFSKLDDKDVDGRTMPYWMMKFNRELKVYVKVGLNQETVHVMRALKRLYLSRQIENIKVIEESRRVEYDQLHKLYTELLLHTATIMPAHGLLEDIAKELNAHDQEEEGQVLRVANNSFVMAVLKKVREAMERDLRLRELYYTPVYVFQSTEGVVGEVPRIGTQMMEVERRVIAAWSEERNAEPPTLGDAAYYEEPEFEGEPEVMPWE